MTKTKGCNNCAKYVQHFKHKDCGICVVNHNPDDTESAPSHWEAKPLTNADRIRNMGDAELASFLSSISLVAKRMSEAAYLTLTQQAALQSHEYMYWRRYLSETVEDK